MQAASGRITPKALAGSRGFGIVDSFVYWKLFTIGFCLSPDKAGIRWCMQLVTACAAARKRTAIEN
jgi:hypothetical protein